MHNKKKETKLYGKKALILVSALTMVFTATVGGTVAWLISSTDKVTNTFTYGDINIELDETDTNIDDNEGEGDGDNDPNTNTYEMVPGTSITKDPTITVKGDSEACWLFVELTESANFGTFMEYNMDGAWTKLEDGVWYQVTTYSAADQTYPVLLNNEVKVRQNITKEMLNALDADESYPTMEVTAYAVQYASIGSAAEAWALAQGE